MITLATQVMMQMNPPSARHAGIDTQSRINVTERGGTVCPGGLLPWSH